MFVTSLKKNCQRPELECKKKRKKRVLQFLVYQRHFMSSIERADSSWVLHFPSALWSSLVAKKNDERKLESQKIIALRYKVEGLKAASPETRFDNGRTPSKLVVPWRLGQLTAPHAEVKVFTHSRKKVARFAFCSEQFPSKFCESTFLQESVSNSSLAQSLIV